MSPAGSCSESGLRLCIIAGEPSGDRLGAPLIESLRAGSSRPLQLFGVGGPSMESQGLESLFPYHELALLGYRDILLQFWTLRRRFHDLIDATLAFRPDIVVTIDIPGFSLPFARKLRKRAISGGKPPLFVQYVAPQVWAWKAGKAVKSAWVFDLCLTVWPFEPPYFTRFGLDSRFVSHPALIHEGAGRAIRDDPSRCTEALVRFGLADGKASHDFSDPVLVLLPGSRKVELRLLLRLFLDVVARLRVLWPNLRVITPTLPHLRDWLHRQITEHGECGPIHLIDDPAARWEAFALADVALFASGSASVELAISETPMVTILPPGFRTRFHMFSLLPCLNMVNIILQQPIIPEFFGEPSRKDSIVREVDRLLSSPARRDAQRHVLKHAVRQLRAGHLDITPSARAAQEILSVFAKREAEKMQLNDGARNDHDPPLHDDHARPSPPKP